MALRVLIGYLCLWSLDSTKRYSKASRVAVGVKMNLARMPNKLLDTIAEVCIHS